MKLVALAFVVSGCAFSAREPVGDDVGVEMPPDGPVVVRSCKAPVPADLRLCIDFEDPSLELRALDGSGQLNDAAATLVMPMPRGAEQAAQLGSLSGLHIAETPDLDLDMFTIEMWIRPDAVPIYRTEHVLLENAGQYAMEYESDTSVRCALAASNSVASRARIPLTTWHHVACRYDGNELRVYVDGSVSGCNRSGNSVETAPTEGTSIGARMMLGAYRDSLRGGIDNVRVYSGAIDEQRLCASAERASCSSRCPEGGGGGD